MSFTCSCSAGVIRLLREKASYRLRARVYHRRNIPTDGVVMSSTVHHAPPASDHRPPARHRCVHDRSAGHRWARTDASPGQDGPCDGGHRRCAQRPAGRERPSHTRWWVGGVNNTQLLTDAEGRFVFLDLPERHVHHHGHEGRLRLWKHAAITQDHAGRRRQEGSGHPGWWPLIRSARSNERLDHCPALVR